MNFSSFYFAYFKVGQALSNPNMSAEERVKRSIANVKLTAFFVLTIWGSLAIGFLGGKVVNNVSLWWQERGKNLNENEKILAKESSENYEAAFRLISVIAGLAIGIFNVMKAKKLI